MGLLRQTKNGGILRHPKHLSQLVGLFARVAVYYDGYYLGESGPGEVSIKSDTDKQDVVFAGAPSGSKPAMQVKTGESLQLAFTLSGNSLSIATLSLLADVMQNRTGQLAENDPKDPNRKKGDTVDAAILGGPIYTPLPSGAIKIVAIDETGRLSDHPEDVLSLYDVQIAVEELMKWNAKEQSQLTLDCLVKSFQFSASQLRNYPTAPFAAFGYIGDNKIAGLPAVVWPDRMSPIVSNIVNQTGGNALTAGTAAAKIIILMDMDMEATFLATTASEFVKHFVLKKTQTGGAESILIGPKEVPKTVALATGAHANLGFIVELKTSYTPNSGDQLVLSVAAGSVSRKDDDGLSNLLNEEDDFMLTIA